MTSIRTRVAIAASLLVSLVPALSIIDAAPAGATADQLKISEFRLRGPNGATDEFIEIFNAGAALTVSAASGTGFGVAASDGLTRCSIPNGTVIPQYGHFLCVNSVGYSLASYPAGVGTTATGDATFTIDIADNAGIALFDNNTGGTSYSLAHRLDAAGSASEANMVYKEGSGYPTLTPFSIDFSFYRSYTTGSISAPAQPIDNAGAPLPKDTGNNSTDFVFVDTNGTSAGAGQRLGAPGPENLSSPVQDGGLAVGLFDPCVAADAAPNAVRDTTSDPANNSTFGTFDLRRTITNNTGAPVTRLRLRVADVRTFPAPSGYADMRPRTSAPVVVTVDRAPCGVGNSNVIVKGTTLEQSPSQPNGGGFNSSLSVGDITLATPLAAGATADVRVLAGMQQTGLNGIRVIAEALPGGTTPSEVTCLSGLATGDPDWCAGAAPVGVADAYPATEDSDLVVPAATGVLANDTDADTSAGDLTAELVSGPANGDLTLDADGGFTYSPDANHNGPDSFTYRAADGTNSSADTVVSLTVAAVNDAPVGVDDTANPAEDTLLSVPAPGLLTNDTDADGDALTVAPGSATAAAHGTVNVSVDGSYTYDPDPDYSGPDSFTYRATDGDGQSATTTVALTVGEANDAPVGVDDAYATSEDTALVQAAPGVLANDTDADLDALAVDSFTTPAHGDVVVNGDGSFTYTPDPHYSGPDSFTYIADDGTVTSPAATVSLTVAPVDGAPMAVDDSYETDSSTPLVEGPSGVLANDTDPDGDALAATLVTGTAHGSIDLAADGSFTYVPNVGFDGTDSFTYTAEAAGATSDPATVSIAVTFAAPAAPPAGTITLELADDELAPGESSEVRGSGFAPNETVRLYLYPGSRVLGTVTADADGDFLAMITVPVGSPAGTYTVVAFGADVTGTTVLTVVAGQVVPGDGTLVRTGAGPLPGAVALVLISTGLGLVLVARRRRRFSPA